MAMENMLEILRKSLKCSIFPGLHQLEEKNVFWASDRSKLPVE